MLRGKMPLSRVIDCTSVGLRSMPRATSTLDNYTSISLRDNYLKHLNFTSLFKVLPQVVLLDLRDNNPLLCHDIMRFQPPKSIKIISECKYSTTEIPTYSTSEFPVTHKTKLATYDQSLVSSELNITAHLTTQISRMKTPDQVIFIR